MGCLIYRNEYWLLPIRDRRHRPARDPGQRGTDRQDWSRATQCTHDSTLTDAVFGTLANRRAGVDYVLEIEQAVEKYYMNLCGS